MNDYIVFIVIGIILLILGCVYFVIKKSLEGKNETFKGEKVEKLSPYNQYDVYRLNILMIMLVLFVRVSQ